MQSSYTPVAYEYREIIEEQISKQTEGKIFYFSESDSFECVEGRIVSLDEIPQKGFFVVLDTGVSVRLDRIITVFGKPGAAFDQYDALGNVCLDCTGGYEL